MTTSAMRGLALLLALVATGGALGTKALHAQGIPDPVADTTVQEILEATDPDQVAEEPETPPVDVDQDPTELVFEREVFSYPSYERRNPFQPLLAAGAGGPRFEDLRLTGILLSSIPGQSAALFTIGQPVIGGLGGGGEQSAVRAVKARVGERVGPGGNTIVIEIQDGLVIVDVEEFGARQRRTMRISRPGGQGGSE